jgi:hypothetical protein
MSVACRQERHRAFSEIASSNFSETQFAFVEGERVGQVAHPQDEVSDL